jgi:uncharacterized membrane protein YuzA (DUF378 family)
MQKQYEEKRSPARSTCTHGYAYMKHINLIAMVLLVIGGINWGLVGIFNYNLVTALLGDASMMTKIVYALVGLCGLYEGFQFLQKRESSA